MWSYAPQTHLAIRLSFETFRPLHVLMTTMYHHGSLLLRALFHLHTVTQNPLACYTSCSMYFFSKCILDHCFFFYLIKYLDFLHFILYLRRIFLISAEWLILSTSFRSFIRKPASTRNDHVENPKSKDLGFADVISTICFSKSLSNLCCL